jgi:hypothetical protein
MLSYLSPSDPKRLVSWEKNVGCFYKALDTLLVGLGEMIEPKQISVIGSRQRPLSW